MSTMTAAEELMAEALGRPRCERHTHGPLSNQCPRPSVLAVLAVTGSRFSHEGTLWMAQACDEHAWEAVALAATRVGVARAAGHDDARVLTIVEAPGEQLLQLLTLVAAPADRWPLATSWAQSA